MSAARARDGCVPGRPLGQLLRGPRHRGPRGLALRCHHGPPGLAFLVSPLLLGAGFLGVFREGFLIAATERLRPSTIGEPTELPMSIGPAVITLVLWTALPLALGAWRTETRDA